ncbi:MAG: hypothetical protein ACO236_00425 [Candidatus Nanopelagicaceae bacterium]
MDLTPEQQERFDYAQQLFNSNKNILDEDFSEFVKESARKVEELKHDLQDMIDSLNIESGANKPDCC